MNIGPVSGSVPPGSSLDVCIELDAGFAAIGGREGRVHPALDGGVVAQVVGASVRGVICVGGGLHLVETCVGKWDVRKVGREGGRGVTWTCTCVFSTLVDAKVLTLLRPRPLGPEPNWTPEVVDMLLVVVSGHGWGEGGGGEGNVQDIGRSVCEVVQAADDAACDDLWEGGLVVSGGGAGEGGTHSAGHGCRGIEEDAHDGVQVEEHEYGRDEVRDEASRWQENGLA